MVTGSHSGRSTNGGRVRMRPPNSGFKKYLSVDTDGFVSLNCNSGYAHSLDCEYYRATADFVGRRRSYHG